MTPDITIQPPPPRRFQPKPPSGFEQVVPPAPPAASQEAPGRVGGKLTPPQPPNEQPAPAAAQGDATKSKTEPPKVNGRRLRRPKRILGNQVQTREEVQTMRLPVLPSIKLASLYLNIPEETIKAAKAKLCPAWDSSGRVDCHVLMSWLFKAGVLIFPDEGMTGDDSDLAGLSYPERDKRATALTREFNLAVRQGKYIARDEVTNGVAKGLGLMFSAIEREFSLQLPPVLKGLDEPQIQAHLTAAAERFKAILRGELDQLISQQQPANESKQS
jgi:hypothetical protein